MTKATLMRKVASFAHLLGLPKAARAEEEDDEKKQRPDESDEDYAKRMEEEDKKDDDSDDEDSDTKSESESDDDGDEEKDSKKSKKAKRAEEDSDSDDAKKAERKRGASIFACASAGVRPDLAAHLAFQTNMSSADAIALLNAAAVGGKTGLASRMSGVKIANVGTDAAEKPAANSPRTLANQIIAAAAKARGEK